MSEFGNTENTDTTPIAATTYSSAPIPVDHTRTADPPQVLSALTEVSTNMARDFGLKPETIIPMTNLKNSEQSETTPLVTTSYGSIPPSAAESLTAASSKISLAPDEPSVKKVRLLHFDTLRTILAVLVMVHHYGYVYGFAPDAASARLRVKINDFPHIHYFLDRAAFFGVTFFFVLSGFMAQYTAKSELTTLVEKRDYLWKRSARLLLGYEVAIFVMIASNRFKLLGSAAGFWVNVFCLQTFFPIHDGDGYRDYYPNAYNEPAWFVSSLLCSQVMYVFFAHNKLIRVEEDQGVHGWTAKYKVASCLLAVCVLRSAPTFSFKFFECVKGVDPSAVEHWAGGHFLDIIYKTPALRIIEFVAGAIAGRLVILMPSDIKEWKFFAHFSDLLVPVTYLWIAYIPDLSQPACGDAHIDVTEEKGFTLFAVLFILCSAMNQSGFFVSRLASMKALILLAPYSFAAYIFQGPMDHIMAFSEYYQWTRGQQTYLFAILVITWTFAAAFVEYVENPINTFLTDPKGRGEQLDAIREYLLRRGLYGNYRKFSYVMDKNQGPYQEV